jgi:hypothetical protein
MINGQRTNYVRIVGSYDFILAFSVILTKLRLMGAFSLTTKVDLGLVLALLEALHFLWSSICSKLAT